MTDEGDDRRAEMSCTKGKNRTEDARVPMGLIAKRAAAEFLRLGLFVSLGIGLTGCLDLPVPAADRQQLLSADLASDRKAERRTPARRRLAVLVKTPEQKEPDKATGPFSLEKLEALARQHNPTLMQAVALVEGEEGKAIQAGLWPNPILGYNGHNIGVQGTAGEMQAGFIQQKIMTGGKLRLSREKYLARVSAAEFQALSQIYSVINGVRVHYYTARGAQQRLQIQQELLKVAEDNLVTVQEKANVGQANRADLHQANVVLQDHQLAVQMAGNQLRMQWERLVTAVGKPLPPGFLEGELEGDLTPLQFDEALERILDESPQLAQAEALLKSDQIKVQRELVEPIPNITVRGDVGRNYEASQTVGNFFAFIEVPVFDWNQGTVLQAKADMRRQQHQVELLELQLRRTLADQFQIYLTALQHVRAYQTVILPQSEARYATQLKSYHEDRLPWHDVLQAQRDFYDRRLLYIDHLVAWRTAKVAIEGLLLVDGLIPPPGVTPPGHIDATPKPR